MQAGNAPGPDGCVCPGQQTKQSALSIPGGAEKGLPSVLQHSTAGASQRSLGLARCPAPRGGHRAPGRGATMYRPSCWPAARPRAHTGDLPEESSSSTGRRPAVRAGSTAPSWQPRRRLGPPIGWGPGVRGQGRGAAKQARASPGLSVPRRSRGSGWKTEARFLEPVPPTVGNPEGLHSGGGTGLAQIMPWGQSVRRAAQRPLCLLTQRGRPGRQGLQLRGDHTDTGEGVGVMHAQMPAL